MLTKFFRVEKSPQMSARKRTKRRKRTRPKNPDAVALGRLGGAKSSAVRKTPGWRVMHDGTKVSWKKNWHLARREMVRLAREERAKFSLERVPNVPAQARPAIEMQNNE